MSMTEASWVEFFVSAKINEKDAENYAKFFIEHDIDLSMGNDLTHNLLSEIGIHPVGHRIKILRYFSFQNQYVSYDNTGLGESAEIKVRKRDLLTEPLSTRRKLERKPTDKSERQREKYEKELEKEKEKAEKQEKEKQEKLEKQEKERLEKQEKQEKHERQEKEKHERHLEKEKLKMAESLKKRDSRYIGAPSNKVLLDGDGIPLVNQDHIEEEGDYTKGVDLDLAGSHKKSLRDKSAVKHDKSDVREFTRKGSKNGLNPTSHSVALPISTSKEKKMKGQSIAELDSSKKAVSMNFESNLEMSHHHHITNNNNTNNTNINNINNKLDNKNDNLAESKDKILPLVPVEEDFEKMTGVIYYINDDIQPHHLPVSMTDTEISNKGGPLTISDIKQLLANVFKAKMVASTMDDFCLFTYNETEQDLKVTKGTQEVNLSVQNIFYVVFATKPGKTIKKLEKRLKKDGQKKFEKTIVGKPIWTSDNCPLLVDFLPSHEVYLTEGGKLGLCMAPGRQKKKPEHVWARDLGKDLDLLVNTYSCQVLVTLLRDQEMVDINTPNLKQEVLNRGIIWKHFPIQDKWIPKKMEGLVDLVEFVIEQLQQGKTVVAHCNGGKGRSGTLLVATLVALGRSVDEAIMILRKTRDGTIRNPVQIGYVKRFKKAWRHRRKRALKLKMKNLNFPLGHDSDESESSGDSSITSSDTDATHSTTVSEEVDHNTTHNDQNNNNHRNHNNNNSTTPSYHIFDHTKPATVTPQNTPTMSTVGFALYNSEPDQGASPAHVSNSTPNPIIPDIVIPNNNNSTNSHNDSSSDTKASPRITVSPRKEKPTKDKKSS